jgi:hypothetical protein
MTTSRVALSAMGGLAALALGLAGWAAPAAQASPHVAAAIKAPALPQVSYKYTFSRIAWTGSRKVIAATDSHHDLYSFWEASSSGTWHKQLVAKGGHSTGYSSPSIAWTGHAVAIAVLDTSGDLLYFSQHSGSTKWSHKTVAKADGHAYQAPSVTAASDGTVLISAGNKSDRLFAFMLAPDSSTWVKQGVSLGGLFGASSITTCYDSIVHAYLGLITATSGGTLYFWWERLDSPGWNQQVIAASGPGGSFSGGSIAATRSDLMITAATTAGTIDLWWQAIGGSTWNEQTVASAGGGASYARPAVIWTKPVLGGSESYDVVTAVTRKGALDYWWKLDGGSTWTRELVAKSGRLAAYANPAIAVNAKSVDITAVNTKPGDVLFWFQPFGTNPWHQQTVAKG